MANRRDVVGVIRSLIDAMNLRTKYAKVLHAWVWDEKGEWCMRGINRGGAREDVWG